MSSASLTSTEAVKHSNYHCSDRGGATPTITQHYEGTKDKHTHTKNELTHMLTLTTVLTNSSKRAKKSYSTKSEIIL